MRIFGVAVSAGLLLLAVITGVATAAPRATRRGGSVRVTTDSHLRPGHLETIKVKGFPGKGNLYASFFPTAICESECGAADLFGGRANAKGEGTMKIRMPGTFEDLHGHHAYFRDRERIEVLVSWEGEDGTFKTGNAEPEPIIVRDHGGRHAPATLAADQFSVSPGSVPKPRLPLPIPPGFQLQASNDYTLYVSALGLTRRDGTLLVVAAAKGREVSYEAPATITETSIHADLGALGQISVEFQRSDKAASVRCNKEQEPIRFDSGSWVGTIDFHGEEGFTDVEATSARGYVEPAALGPFCGGISTGGTSERAKGAELYVRNPGLGPRLSVYKHRPGAAALIIAYLSEWIDGIRIDRATGKWIPGRDFAYAPNLRTATVAPPGPFNGSARFDLGARAGRRWSGDLTVDMPGRADVPLTGPLLRAGLIPSE
ncbi:MAG: hypothetical protein JST59_09315 [Actinobacteria bacterium]|nr:hypothetical protein [Actinomycetota bacterium]